MENGGTIVIKVIFIAGRDMQKWLTQFMSHQGFESDDGGELVKDSSSDDEESSEVGFHDKRTYSFNFFKYYPVSSFLIAGHV